METLLVDNNDSFTYNLEHLLVRVTGDTPTVIPYDLLKKSQIDDYDWIVISPGPMTPADYPNYARIFQGPIPVLGICLGMQIINEQFGGTTAPLVGCYHGRTDEIDFQGIRHNVARYHSLYAASVGDNLEVIASNRDGVPMAIRHTRRPIIGYQFHPESFLTPAGEHFIEYALRDYTNDRHGALSVDSVGA